VSETTDRPDVMALFNRRSEVDRVFLSAVHKPALGLIRFAGGLPDPTTYPREVLAELLDDIVRRGPVDVLSYDLDGEPTLRTAIARRMERRGAGAITPDQVIGTHGCAGAITLTAHALIDTGDVVLAEELSYPGSLRAFEIAGAEIVRVPLDADGIRVDDMERIVGELRRAGRSVKAVYTISSFHNPTATVLTEERRVALADAARRLDLVILQDDTYGELDYDGLAPTPLLALAPERTIHLGSFSKIIAPGLRLGWAAASPPIIRALTNVRTDLGAPPVVQRVVAEYIDRGHLDRHVAQVLPHYAAKRDAMVEAASEHLSSHCTWTVPRGAFFLWLTPTGPLDVARFADAAYRHGATFLDASYFLAEDRDVGFRLSYGDLPVDDLREGVRRLGVALAELAGS
jgi:2-aminoadipate transaminase